MSDQDLKHELASQYADNYRTASRDDAYGAYIDGWDAARANQVDGWLAHVLGLHVTNIDNLIKERDQLRAEVEKLRHELYNRIPIRIESPEYNELKAQCEKLVKALEKYANPETHSMDKDGEVWYGDYFDYETAQNALAEYRKSKGE